MLVSNCCGARFYEPDYPDNDICTDCGEHAGAEEEDEDEFDDESTWKEQEEHLNYKERRPKDG